MQITEHRNWRGLEKVTTDVVRSYLLRNDWIPASYPQNPRVSVYQRGHDVMMLPHEGTSDYYNRLAEAIDTLASIEDQPTYVMFQRFVQGEQS